VAIPDSEKVQPGSEVQAIERLREEVNAMGTAPDYVYDVWGHLVYNEDGEPVER